MKKTLLSLLCLLLAMSFIYAGGIVTNSNQSTAWARMLVRDASTSIDAVFYNPAGLTKLSDGLHVSISNQSIFQSRTLDNSFTYLNESEFKGEVNAFVFPNVYAVYKTGKFAFSLGFTPIGGGGSAEFDKGIPMIELPFASLVPTFQNYGVTGYDVNVNFKGSSVYFGIQAGVSYAINDMISVYAGARYVWAKNKYKGSVSDATVTTTGGDIDAQTFMTGLADQATAGATQATAGGDAMQPLITGGAGGLTFAQAEGATLITATQRAQMEGGLLALGLTQAQIDAMDLAAAQTTYYGAATNLTTQAAQLNASSVLMADQEADVEQTGNGYCPIIGLNLSFMEDKLNIGIKYEFNTELEITNKTPEGKGFTMGINPVDGSPIEMFPDGEKTNADIPALLSIGVRYNITDDFNVHLGYHNYFDKNTGWEGVDLIIDKNLWEGAIGFEYNINEQLLLSAGYLRGETGVNSQLYDTDISYSLSSNTFGLGGAYKINDMLTLQLGSYYTAYVSNKLSYDYELSDGVTSIPYTQEYAKRNIAFSIGLDFTFGGK